MRRHRTVRFTAVVIGALMLATMVPVAVPSALADAAPFAVTEARLTALDGAHEDHFGSAVDIDGDTLVVGAPDSDLYGTIADAGAAYVYVRSGTAWTFQQKLASPAYNVDDRFGTSVAIEGDTIVVGAPHAFTAHGYSGAAFVYQRTGTTWSAGSKLPTEFEQDGDQIGQAVAIDGDTIVLGCPGDESQRGELRPIVWNGTAWDSGGGMTLSDPEGQPGDRLGGCVAISADTIMASEGGDDRGALVDAGSVVAFLNSDSGWSFEEKWAAPVPVEGEQYGGPIDLSDSGDVAIVGSPAHDTGDGFDAGVAYVYCRSFDWVLWETLENPGPNSPDGDWFGSAVAIDGDHFAMVGAFWDDSHTGAAYYYAVENGEWVMKKKIDMTAEDPGVALFGDSVAIDDGTAVVGATLASAGVPGVLPGAAFVFNSRGTISGVVRDGNTGEPLEGIEMSAYATDVFGEPIRAEGESVVFTDADGRYSLSLNTGAYPVGWMDDVYPSGFFPGVELWWDATPVPVLAGETTVIDVDLYLNKTKTQTFAKSANRFHSAVQRARLMEGR